MNHLKRYYKFHNQESLKREREKKIETWEFPIVKDIPERHRIKTLEVSLSRRNLEAIFLEKMILRENAILL